MNFSHLLFCRYTCCWPFELLRSLLDSIVCRTPVQPIHFTRLFERASAQWGENGWREKGERSRALRIDTLRGNGASNGGQYSQFCRLPSLAVCCTVLGRSKFELTPPISHALFPRPQLGLWRYWLPAHHLASFLFRTIAKLSRFKGIDKLY